MSPKKSQLVMIILSMIGLVLVLFATGGQSVNTVLMVIGFCFVMAGLIINLIFWKCPSCGRHLPKGPIDMTYCPYCGESID
ncbi:MAG: hypothetical protein IJA58_06595 [Lachnospiraceae bacterium]|nr:hypothetical protein [Lachnospiraceae bacterium]